MSNLVIVNLVLLALFLGDVSRATAGSSSAVKCGVRPRTGRIIGGVNAKPHSWPWQCSIQVYKQHLCGCSVIAPTWIITAAHCKFDQHGNPYPTHFMSVVVGAHRIEKLDESSQKRHYIQQLIVHEKYDWDSDQNDVMLIRVNGSIQFNSNVKPICVDDSVFPTDTPCYATGWGSISTNVDVFVAPTQLQEVVVRTLSSSICERPDWYGKSFDKTTMICAGYAEGKRDACIGDSGGPLVCRDPSGIWKLIGLTSWGGPDACGAAKQPGVYTRVEHYMDWIKERVDDLSPSKPYRTRRSTRSSRTEET